MLDYLKKIFRKKECTKISNEEKFENLFNDTYSTDVVRFEIGTDIAMCGEDIGKEISLYREDLAEKTGFIFPLVHIVENFSIQENQIKIFVQEKEINEEFLIPNKEKILEEIPRFLEDIYENYLDKIFTSEYLEKFLLKVQEKNAWLVWDISCMYTIAHLKEIFISILKKDKSIKNISYIFQKIEEIVVKKYADCCVILKPEEIVLAISKVL